MRLPKMMAMAQKAARAVLALAIGLSILHASANEQTAPVAKISPASEASAIVGEVVFSVGPVQALVAANRLDGSAPVQAVLSRGHKLKVGDQLITGAGGHVHVRFIDGAFVAVRPESQLTIEQYSYKPEQPERSAVKFQLTQGTARSITGRAGEAAKDRFRLNTPVAAIGVRGTDFVVLTQDSESRAVVNRGAIVVAPIGQGCAAEGLGPCAGLFARELTPAMGDLMARVERGQIELVAARGLAPERSSPLGAEPRAMKEKDAPALSQALVSAPSAASASVTSHVAGSAVASVASDGGLAAQEKASANLLSPKNEQGALERVALAGTSASASTPSAGGSSGVGSALGATGAGTGASVGSGLSEPSALDKAAMSETAKAADQQTGATSTGQELVIANPLAKTYGNPLASSLKAASLHWGRWGAQPLAGDPSETAVALMIKGASTVMTGSDWSLFTLGSTQSARPRDGMVDFVLRDALAYYQPVLGAASQAEVLSGSLGMDFAKASFSSRLNAKHDDLGQVLVMIHGTISADGQLQSAADSPASATGLLANEASEAAYRFNQRVTDTKGRVGSLFGLTRWGR